MKPLKLGLMAALAQCSRYPRQSDADRAALRSCRLAQLVAYARQNSPYYARLYQGLGAQPALAQLPPVNKQQLMAHWDDWVTDRTVTLAQARAFIRDQANLGRRLNGKYLVFTTSGSTGSPLVALCDPTANNVMSAVNVARSYARPQDMRAFIRRGGKSIGVFATGGFYLSNNSVQARLRQMPWKKRQLAVTSALLPTPQIVAQLNAFQPAMLGGYPSNLALLIDEQRSGRLHIAPVIIMTGGEHLSDDLRHRLADAFGCYVQTSYSCTEGGTIACECACGRFHLNDDWVLVEPVDAENRPVPPGAQAEKLLLTNLFNYTQPFIRYELTDRTVLHTEPCPCGCRSPWLTLEGRTDDVVTFVQQGRPVQLPPLAIYATLSQVQSLRRFQFVATGPSGAQLRVEPAPGVPAQAAFAQAQAALTPFFALHGLTQVEVTLSPQPPSPDARSGKFKHILCAPR